MAVKGSSEAARAVYHICAAADWQAALRRGRYDGSALDRRDGFIHLSTAAQLPATAARFFAGRDGLVVLEVAAASLGPALRWEQAPDGEVYPHLYGGLEAARIGAVHPLAAEDAGEDRFAFLRKRLDK